MIVNLMLPHCTICRGITGVISGDGPDVCGDCIEARTRAAADPMDATAQLRDQLQELHGDIVVLGETDAGAQAWEWQGWA